MKCKDYFEEAYRTLQDSTINKIKYLRKFLNEDNCIYLKSICNSTIHDSDYEYCRKILLKSIDKS